METNLRVCKESGMRIYFVPGDIFESQAFMREYGHYRPIIINDDTRISIVEKCYVIFACNHSLTKLQQLPKLLNSKDAKFDIYVPNCSRNHK